MCRKTEELGLPDMPDMYFAENFIEFHHTKSNFKLRFNPEDAIKGIQLFSFFPLSSIPRLRMLD